VISAAELTSLATSHDIIRIGMLADDLRRQRHGAQTTFVRVATTSADAGAPVVCPPSAGELAQAIDRRLSADAYYDDVNGSAPYKRHVVRHLAEEVRRELVDGGRP